MWLNARLYPEGGNRLHSRYCFSSLRLLELFTVACIILMLIPCASSFHEVVLELILCLLSLPA